MEITLLDLVLSYLLTMLVFFAIDILWLGLIAKKLYNRLLRNHLSKKVNWPAAIIFYLIFIVGIFVFAIVPAVENVNPMQSLQSGVLFGFFTYATYDLTNLATLKKWPIKIVFIDIIWGMVLTGSVAISGYYITSWLIS